MNFQKNTQQERLIELFVFLSLFGFMFALELYGAILVSTLFAGFIYFVGRSRKYESVNSFIDSFFN